MLRIGNAVINPRLVQSTTIEEKTGFLGLWDGWYIECKMTDGKTIAIKDSNGECFPSPIPAGLELDKIVRRTNIEVVPLYSRDFSHELGGAPQQNDLNSNI